MGANQHPAQRPFALDDLKLPKASGLVGRDVVAQGLGVGRRTGKGAGKRCPAIGASLLQYHVGQPAVNRRLYLAAQPPKCNTPGRSCASKAS